MNPLNQRSRSVFITTYNLSAVEAINWQRLIDTWHLTYAVGNKETCPDTGRLHYHMLLCFDMPIRFKDIQRRLNDFTCHIQPTWGTFKQARDYVIKKGITFEYGEPLEQGKRSDLDRVYESIKVGADLLDIWSVQLVNTKYYFWEFQSKILLASWTQHKYLFVI